MRKQLTACFTALAISSVGTPLARAADEHQDLGKIGAKLSDPTSDVWALFTEFDATYSEGDLSGGDHRSGSSMTFKPIMPVPFTENWKIFTQPTVPVTFSTDIPVGRRSDNSDLPGHPGVGIRPDGTAAFEAYDGLGDISIPLMFMPAKKKQGAHWAFGAGPTFLFPTATNDELGTNTWEAGPSVVAVYKTPKFTGALMGQYWWNYAETDSDATDTSHGTLLYSAWWNLPGAWQVGFNPTISYNAKAANGDEWNVPVGFGVARTIRIGKMPVKFQLSAEKSIVRQDDFGTDWKIRFNIIPVIPSLVKRPLFD
jgi:hypothetical protein